MKSVSLPQNQKKNKSMCTYNISIDDTLMERVRPAFADNAAIRAWMQSQVEILLWQMVVEKQGKADSAMKLSQRLRGIAHAPADFDYKKELANRY